MQRIGRYGLPLPAAALWALLSGCAGAPADDPPPAEPPPGEPSLAVPTHPGARVFDTNCAPCHGIGGDGLGVPERSLVNVSRHRDAEIIRTIENGRGEEMPPWKGTLTDEEILAVVDYIKTF